MILKNFRFKIILRIALLIGTILLFLFFHSGKKYYFSLILTSIIFVYQIIEFISFVEKSNRYLTQFLQSIRYSDFSQTFQVGDLETSFDSLKQAFNLVVADFQKIRNEKEENYFYIQNIIQHIEIGIISFSKDDGKIDMINNSAKKLLQIHNIKNISDLRESNTELSDLLSKVKTGENYLLKLQGNEDILQLSIHVSEFKLDNRWVTLVSIKDIQSELEEQEMEAWQKLIRVLTHEIMNSITPISSLSTTAHLLVKDIAESLEGNYPEGLEKDTFDDISAALETINRRSIGLIHFVETYRNLTRVPKPNFTIFDLKTMFDYLQKVFEPKLHEKNIQYIFSVEPENMKIIADEQLIEQVLINLITNSIHALENTQKASIEMNGFMNTRGKAIIQVIDNGQGILKDVKDKIFIPFFTTKPNGSGIGLSLSKQILRLHNGNITVESEPEVRTCFTITL